MSLYEIAFSGQLVPGADSEQVRTNLARLFQADAQRIAALFSGRRIVIKNGLDASTAEKYRLAMERAGARAEVVAMAVEVEEVELAPPPPVEPAPAARPRRLQVAPRDEYMAAFSEVDAPDFGLAPLGADLQDARPEPVAPRVDLTQFSLAPVGSDMGQVKAAPPAPAPYTSHLKLQD